MGRLPASLIRFRGSVSARAAWGVANSANFAYLDRFYPILAALSGHNRDTVVRTQSGRTPRNVMLDVFLMATAAVGPTATPTRVDGSDHLCASNTATQSRRRRTAPLRRTEPTRRTASRWSSSIGPSSLRRFQKRRPLPIRLSPLLRRSGPRYSPTSIHLAGSIHLVPVFAETKNPWHSPGHKTVPAVKSDPVSRGSRSRPHSDDRTARSTRASVLGQRAGVHGEVALDGRLLATPRGDRAPFLSHSLRYARNGPGRTRRNVASLAGFRDQE